MPTADHAEQDERLFSVDDLPERGGCGVGGVVDVAGRATRDNVETAMSAMCDMDIRGGRIDDTGDGGGLMVRTDAMREFFMQFIPPGKHVPDDERLYVGKFSVDTSGHFEMDHIKEQLRQIADGYGLHVFGFRDVPVDSSVVGERAQKTEPIHLQMLFTRGHVGEDALPQRLFEAKMAIETRLAGVYADSMQRGTLVYKGMMTGSQLKKYFLDFRDVLFVTDAILYHIRYSTNVRARWALAQMFRILGHNGEIVNINSLRAAIVNLAKSIGLDYVPLARDGSDSADFDRVIEFSTSHGVPLSEALRRAMPRAGDDVALMPRTVQQYVEATRLADGSIIGEGPMGVLAMDDREVVAAMDTDGLRPLRGSLMDDGTVHFASEVGAGDDVTDRVRRVVQLDAGEMMIVRDFRVIMPDRADMDIVSRTVFKNFRAVASRGRIIPLKPANEACEAVRREDAIHTWNVFGGTHTLLTGDGERPGMLKFMAENGREPVKGMGRDTPLAVFSKVRPRVAEYMHSNAGVVTVPPKDHIREKGAMDTGVILGSKPEAVDIGKLYRPSRMHKLETPVLRESEFRGLVVPGHTDNLKSIILDTSFLGTTKKEHDEHIEKLTREAIRIAREGKFPIIVLSDRNVTTDDRRQYVEMPMAVGIIARALHKAGLYRSVSIVCDTGSALEAHDIGVLVSEGAHAVNPYAMWQAASANIMNAYIVEKLEDGSPKRRPMTPGEIEENIYSSLKAQVKKIYSKTGTLSTRGFLNSKQFEAVGMSGFLTSYYLRGAKSKVSGIWIEDILEDQIERKKRGRDKVFQNPDKGSWNKQVREILDKALWQGGERFETPEAAFKAFAKEVDSLDPIFLSDLLRFKKRDTQLTPEAEAELIDSWQKMIIEGGVVQGGDMSHGALSLTAHRAIGGAFNDLGGVSGSGEGGEHAERRTGGKWEGDISKRRQLASGRFGATAEFFSDPAITEVCIKIGQGAKPGEGGQLPAHKLTADIAAQRRTQAGIETISPPTNHDVYSIEDLALLISSIRALNPKLKICVKIPAVSNIGTIAVGVAKAGADTITVAGFEGGTGAAQVSSIEHCGLPRELGLAECHQMLTKDGVRDLIELRVDGGIKTPSDVLKMMALGADGVDLGTALMIAGERCIFCNKCDGGRGQCPTGLCTQDEDAQRQMGFGGVKRKVIDSRNKEEREEDQYNTCKAATKHYIEMLSKGVCEGLARLGLKSPRELVGRTDLLEQFSVSQIFWDSLNHEQKKDPKNIEQHRHLKRCDRVNLQFLLDENAREKYINLMREGVATRVKRTLKQSAVNDSNQYLVDEANKGEQLISRRLRSPDRNFGATLAGVIAKHRILRDTNFPEKPIVIETTGSGGQKYGVWCVDGMIMRHTGLLNDYVGAGMSGGKIIVVPPKQIKNGSSLAGNGCAYGATGGEQYYRGYVGQRFGVRNSGATLIAEGTGKYAFEYMTGGIGINIGRPGNVIGTGMTGGELFYYAKNPGAVQNRLSHDYVESVSMDDASLGRLKENLINYAKETDSPNTLRILKNWEKEKHRFMHIVPKRR
ncbi:MAG: glutamate synthase-related protein [Patescibacteria group bacterium]